MNYANVVEDFASRTKKNLETLRQLQKQHPEIEIYDVTQLINSMLGLLVFPQQSYFKKIPKITLVELQTQGWPIPKVTPSSKQAKNLRDLMRYMRNSVAHCNIIFLTDDRNVIIGLRMWNTWKSDDKLLRVTKSGEQTWIARLIEDLPKSRGAMHKETDENFLMVTKKDEQTWKAEFVNEPTTTKRKTITWEAELTVHDLEIITEKFIELILEKNQNNLHLPFPGAQK